MQNESSFQKTYDAKTFDLLFVILKDEEEALRTF
jgi:hypothetical protein